MEIRTTTTADTHILSALHTACFPRGWSEAEFASFFSQGNVIALLSEQDNQPAGFIFCWMVAEECELLSLAVTEPFRGKGIAKMLLNTALDTLRECGVSAVHLEVNVNNFAAIALYQNAGFTIIGRRKNYYTHADGTRADAVTMRLALGEMAG